MADERTIKIFLASSEELENDRNAFGNLVRILDKIYEKRGIRIELFEWEDYDAAYNNRRKQDEYNDQVRASDMFLALFHIKAGKYTIEEFDVATEEFKRTGKIPKSYVYCRDLQDGEQESEELKEFKHRLFEEMGYYWCRYNNTDRLHLHFVMQLQLVENSRMDDLNVQDGTICLGDTPIAHMDNLRFAADNEDYQRMSRRLTELPQKIEKKRLHIEKYPDDADAQDELQELLNERNKLQKAFDQQQQFLFDTAKRIAQLQGDTITDRMRRAIDAFDQGNVREANIILKEAKRDADRNLSDYKQSKEITEQKRQNVIHSIDELLLKTSTVMADASIDIEQRIFEVKSIYAKADELAQGVDYDKEKYAKLLFDYAQFLHKYAFYNESVDVYRRQIDLSVKLYGSEHSDTAASYNEIGLVYKKQGDYSQALKYYFKAMAICEKVLGEEHPCTATLYNNIGEVNYVQGDYPHALKYHFKALKIREIVLGNEHPDTATSYNNISSVYESKGDYPQALKYHFKALAINEKVLGNEHPATATSYNNIGGVYQAKGDYTHASEYYFKALSICEKIFGKEHPLTATLYDNIGALYYAQSDYSQALEYHFKAKAIYEIVLGKEHPDTATSYNNIGAVYDSQGDYPKALEYYFKALAIREKVLGKEHPDTAYSYNNIGVTLFYQGKYQESLDYSTRAFNIFEVALGPNHPNTITVKKWMDSVK